MAQLLSNLPDRALIKFGSHQVGSETAQPIVWMVADRNHKGYPANSVTLITEKIIDLRAYDASEEDEYGEEYYYGNYEYKLSNIHQWLNSDASAGGWYSASHSDDMPPDYNVRPGFLYNFTTEERIALLPTTIPLQPLSTSGTSTESIVAKVFLPSAYEIFGKYDMSDNSSRLSCFLSGGMSCGLTEQAYVNTSSSSKPETISNIWRYMTRTHYRPKVYGIFSSVEYMSDYPDRTDWGVRPLVNLAANTKISDTTDDDGCYVILPQSVPIISGNNGDLGVENNGFTQAYTIDDDDDTDVISVKEYIDNVEVRSYVATIGVENTFDVTGKTWLKLANGSHTLKVVATDGFDEVERTYTFIKSVDSLVVQRETPIATDKRPTNIIVTVVKNIPYDAKLKVEVCNNGFDDKEKIAWETIEDSGTSVFKHTFNNLGCYSGQWGVNIRVTVDRNGSEGACYITEIGGNFE